MTTPSINDHRSLASLLRRWTLPGGLIALTALVGCASPSAAQPGWRAPAPLPSAQANALMRWPVLATVGETVFLAANLYPTVGTTAIERPLMLRRFPGGETLEGPRGDFQFAFPKIAARTASDIDLVWAEFDSVRHFVISWPTAIQTTLWHARLHNGQWSTPEQIYHAIGLKWTEDNGHLAIDRKGRLHAVVWAQRDSFSGIVHLAQDSTGWHAVPTVPGLLHDATAVVSWSNSMFAAYDAGFGAEENKGVTIIRSVDDGSSWSAPFLVRPLQERRMVRPVFLEARGSLFLAWGEQPVNKTAIDSVRLARWESRAGSWTVVRALALPRGTIAFSMAAAVCGEFAVLAEAFAGKPQVIELSFDSTTAIRQEEMFGGQMSALTGIATTPTRFVAVLATSERPGEIPFQAVSTSRPVCQPPH